MRRGSDAAARLGSHRGGLLLMAMFVTCAGFPALAADDSSTGTLFVVVMDSGSRPVQDAKIAVESSDGLKFGAATGTNGTWEFAVPEGDYTIAVSKQGFRTQAIFKRVPRAVNVTAPFNLAADPEGPVDSGFYAWTGVLSAVVVLGAVGLVLKRRRTKRYEAEAKEAAAVGASKEGSGASSSRAEETSSKAAKTGGDQPAKKKIDIVDEKGDD